MSQSRMTRRALMAGAAAVVPAAGMATLPALARHDPMLELIRRIRAEEAWIDAGGFDDDSINDAMERTVEATTREIIAQRPPVTTPEGAVVALNYVLKELWEFAGDAPGEVMDRTILEAVRDYIAKSAGVPT